MWVEEGAGSSGTEQRKQRVGVSRRGGRRIGRRGKQPRQAHAVVRGLRVDSMVVE